MNISQGLFFFFKVCIKDFQGTLTKRKVMIIMIISQLKYNPGTSSLLEVLHVTLQM